MSNMVVQTNVLAINAHRNMKGVGILQQKASERLSSGFKINRAADDAAGLAISEKMRAQIRGLEMASKNAQDGISMLQTAEGGLAQVDDMMQRIRELTVQGANDTNTTDSLEALGSGVTGAKGDRDKIVEEMNQLLTEIYVTSKKIKFNNRFLLDGSLASASNVAFQVGSNANSNASVDDLDGNLLHVGVSLDLKAIVNSLASASSQDAAGTDSDGVANISQAKVDGASTAVQWNQYIGEIDAQLTKVVKARAKLGAYSNRLEYTIKNNDIANENITSAESRIRDTDMAKEMMNLTKANILQQSTISILSQANQNPQALLNLLR